jgi:Domain of unknown function (DUF4440)
MRELEKARAELDAMHLEAREAFERRDLAAYRALFAPELTYCQADGRVIGRDQLMRDVAAQFRRLSGFRSSFVREAIEIGDGRANELLTQTGCTCATAFFIVHRVWEFSRRSRFFWTDVGKRWRIERVEVIKEHVSTGRFQIRMRPTIESRWAMRGKRS